MSSSSAPASLPPTPVCQITEAGIGRPDFPTVLAYVQAVYRSIYGQDVYLGEDCQDGQLMVLFAQAISDCNGQAVAVYNSFSPGTAIENGLSSVVKINGIRRKTPSYSTCDFALGGRVGTTITGGVITDPNGYKWDLPTVTIPASGLAVATATCETAGAIALPARAVDTLNGAGSIANPQLGWQSATNLAAATPGNPVEKDSQLRQRQALSVALPSQTILEGLVGALLALPGVARVKVYENDNNIPDPVTAAPEHTLSAVVDGGDTTAIAATIAAKKSPGVGTYGDQLTVLQDKYGIPHNIRFFRPVQLALSYSVLVRPKSGYTLDVAAAIQSSLADYTSGLDIGALLQLDDARTAAKLPGDARSSTFELVSLSVVRRDGSSDTYGDIQAAFNQAPICAISDVTIRTTTP